MGDRHGVRKGQRVRSIDGEDLGRVSALYDWGFAARKGFPILFARDSVFRWDEIRAVRDGALVLSRSDRDLFELAAGGIPASWRVPVPHGFPAAATPSEALGLRATVASWPVKGVRPGSAPATPASPSGTALDPSQALQARAAAAGARGEVAPEEEAAFVETRGQAGPPSLIWRREDADRHAT